MDFQEKVRNMQNDIWSATQNKDWKEVARLKQILWKIVDDSVNRRAIPTGTDDLLVLTPDEQPGT